jgi:tripartite ATP-independent transporter DctP family solute receptor
MKYRVILLIGILVFSSISCDSGSIKKVSRDGSPAEKIILKVAHNGSEQHPFQAGFEKFKEVMEAETNGVVEVQIFPNAQLGSEEEASQMVMLGLLSASAAGSASLGTFVPEVELFNLPFIFRDMPHFYKVLDGPVGDQVATKIEETLDCVVLGYWFSGIRNVWNKERPVETPDDLRGLKIRVMSSPMLVETFNALGAQATPMSYGQVYSALATGVVDGAETDHIDLFLDRFYDEAKYVSYTNHMFLSIGLIFSRKQFDNLPPHIQEVVLKAGRESVIAEREAMKSMTNEALVELKKMGLEFNEVDKKPFLEKVASVYENNAKKVGGWEVIESVRQQ